MFAPYLSILVISVGNWGPVSYYIIWNAWAICQKEVEREKSEAQTQKSENQQKSNKA
jgi:hypothetical protein